MANQPPTMARPLFRLPSVARPFPALEVQPQPPAPQPWPPLVRPAFTMPFRPSTAQAQATQPQESAPPPPAATSASVPTFPIPRTIAPSSSLPTSLPQKASPSSTMLPVTSSSSAPTSPTPKATSTTVTTAHVPTPTPSPKTIKPWAAQTPSHSPKIKLPAPPPSPLTLPPSLNGDSRITHNGKHEVTIDVETKEKGIHKKFSNSEEVGMRVITIAGENKGAFMDLRHSQNKHDNESGSYSMRNSSNDEGKSEMTDKSRKKMAMPSTPMSAFINSNVQDVNNSILYNSSYTHHDPGVHLGLSGKPTGGRGIHLKDHVNGHRT